LLAEIFFKLRLLPVSAVGLLLSIDLFTGRMVDGARIFDETKLI